MNVSSLSPKTKTIQKLYVFLGGLLLGGIILSSQGFSIDASFGYGGGGGVMAHRQCINTICQDVAGAGGNTCDTNVECASNNNGAVTNQNRNSTSTNQNTNGGQSGANTNGSPIFYADGQPSIPFELRAQYAMTDLDTKITEIQTIIHDFIYSRLFTKEVFSDGVLISRENIPKTQPITRIELVKILVEWEHGLLTRIPTSDPFPDVLRGNVYAPYLAQAKSDGWIEGYPDGNFYPANGINRVEVIKLLLKSQYPDSNIKGGVMNFTDTIKGQWYERYVAFAVLKGIVEGYRGSNGRLTGKFGPADIVNREEIGTIMYRLKTAGK